MSGPDSTQLGALVPSPDRSGAQRCVRRRGTMLFRPRGAWHPASL